MLPLFGVVALVSMKRVEAVSDIAQTFVGGNDVSKMVNTFNRWIDEHGGESWSKIQIKEIPEYRLGTIAREDINEDDVYLSIPWKLVISEDKIVESEHSASFRILEDQYGFTMSLKLITFLLLEKNKGPRSFWKPYIDTLPASFNTPLFWTDEDLSELKGTGVPEDAMSWRENAKREYERFERGLKSDVGEAMFGVEYAKSFDFDEFLWANAILDSRTIWIDGRYRCFLPMLDMVNCKDHPTRKHTTTRNLDSDSTVTKSIWSVKTGEQLFENYATTNKQNLLYHGFILLKNSFDSIEFTLSDAKSVHEKRPELLPILRRSQLRPVYRIQHGDLPPGLLALARILVLEKADLEAARQFDFVRRPFSPENEKKALRMLQSELESNLRHRFATPSIVEDEILLAGNDLAIGNRRTATQFRLQQKMILSAARDMVVKRLSGARGGEL